VSLFVNETAAGAVADLGSPPVVATVPIARTRVYRRSVRLIALALALGTFAFLPFVLAAIHAARTHQLFLGGPVSIRTTSFSTSPGFVPLTTA
jgi:hypothetical protein